MYHCAIYSATSFLGKCRKMVLEKWFCKSRFFFWSTIFLEPDFSWIYSMKSHFFLVNHFFQTKFLKPYFSNQISKNCKNRGFRIKGSLCHRARRKANGLDLEHLSQDICAIFLPNDEFSVDFELVEFTFPIA